MLRRFMVEIPQVPRDSFLILVFRGYFRHHILM